MVSSGFTITQRLAALGRDRRGNVAMMWGLVGTVLIGLVGLTVDFTRAQSIRAAMQNAADGAALVAERSSNLSIADRTAAARAFFDAEMGDLSAGVTFSVTELEEGGHRVTASSPMGMSLASLVSNSPWTIAVASEAEANASPPIEVVMALDNTGSMSNDMGIEDRRRHLAAQVAGRGRAGVVHPRQQRAAHDLVQQGPDQRQHGPVQHLRVARSVVARRLSRPSRR